MQIQNSQENQSEVARLRWQMNAENIAAERAMKSTAYGTAKHAFITARMERMGVLHAQLKSIVSDEEAAEILVQTMNGQRRKDNQSRP